MNTHDVDDDVRSALGGLAASIDVPGLLPLSEVEPLAGRRARRRQIFGGLATVILVAMVTISVGVMRQGETPNAVFAGQVDQPLVPGVVLADGDRFVGLAAIDPFEPDEQDNVHIVVVTSTDAEQWERVEGSPVLIGNGGVLGKENGVFHVVSIRGVEVVALDGTASIERGLVHWTSTGLVAWTEKTHPMPEKADAEGRSTQIEDLAFTETGPVVLLGHYVAFPDVEAELEALGVDRADVCDFAGQSGMSRIRLCGETDIISVPSPSFLSFVVAHELAKLSDGTAEYYELPEADDGPASPSGRSGAELYQTDDGVGSSARDVFESTDGITWEQMDLGREPVVLMAASGTERVFRSVVHVERYRTDDPVTGMGYSDDGGETWEQVNIDDLFVEDEVGLRFFSDLTAMPNGWALVAGRTLKDRPAVAGVEREADDESAFTVTVDGYEFAGQTPFGAAELRDPDGVVVRSWDHLEVAHPVWSGLEVAGGGVMIRAENGPESEAESITVTAEQWSALVDPLGPTAFDVLFSPDGVDWTILDTSSAMTRVLATSPDGVIVQRWALGHYSQVVPQVELLPFAISTD